MCYIGKKIGTKSALLEEKSPMISNV